MTLNAGAVVGTGVLEGGIGVAVGGTNVRVGGMGVAVGGIDVSLGGTVVVAGGIDVARGLFGVDVAKTRADGSEPVGGIDVAVLTYVLASRCTSEPLLIAPCQDSVPAIIDRNVSRLASGTLE